MRSTASSCLLPTGVDMMGRSLLQYCTLWLRKGLTKGTSAHQS